MKYDKGSFITVPSKETLSGLPSQLQTLYMWLCSYANETGECFPSRATLARNCGCSVRTIDESMEKLVFCELVKKRKRVDDGENLTNVYTVMVLGGSAKSAPPSAKSAQPLVQNLRTELNPILTKESESEIRVVPELKENTNTDAGKIRDGFEIGYKELCDWAEKRRGARFIGRAKQYKHLKRARVNGINPAQLKKRWREIENDDWRDGLDWASVVNSFDKRP